MRSRYYFTLVLWCFRLRLFSSPHGSFSRYLSHLFPSEAVSQFLLAPSLARLEWVEFLLVAGIGTTADQKLLAHWLSVIRAHSAATEPISNRGWEITMVETGLPLCVCVCVCDCEHVIVRYVDTYLTARIQLHSAHTHLLTNAQQVLNRKWTETDNKKMW